MTMGTRHLLLPTTQGGPWAQDPASVKPDYTMPSSSSNNNKHPKSQMISSPASATKGTKLETLSSEVAFYIHTGNQMFLFLMRVYCSCS